MQLAACEEFAAWLRWLGPSGFTYSIHQHSRSKQDGGLVRSKLWCHVCKWCSGLTYVLVAVLDTKQEVCLFHAGCVSNNLLPGCWHSQCHWCLEAERMLSSTPEGLSVCEARCLESVKLHLEQARPW